MCDSLIVRDWDERIWFTKLDDEKDAIFLRFLKHMPASKHNHNQDYISARVANIKFQLCPVSLRNQDNENNYK